MADRYVVDTHALYWYLTGDRRLTPRARETVDRRRDPEAEVLVSAITVAELYYVNQKAGGPLDFGRELERMASGGLRFASFESSDVLLFDRLARVPEMHDRIIAALAVKQEAALVTRDRSLAEVAGVPVVW